MKYIKFALLIFFLVPISCFASTNTYQRTMENLIVPKDVIVDNNNINDILSTPAVSSMEKVYDYADLYSEEEEKKLYKQISKYINNTNIDVALVTTKDLNGFSLSDYSYHFYDYNDFENNGVIFVIYVDNIEPHIFMGNSGVATSIYTDDYIKQILSYVYKDINAKNYFQGTTDYFRIIDGLYQGGGEYRVNAKGKVVKFIPWIEIVVLAGSLSFLIILGILSILKRKYKKIFKNVLDSKLDNNTLVVKMEYDKLVDTMVSNK